MELEDDEIKAALITFDNVASEWTIDPSLDSHKPQVSTIRKLKQEAEKRNLDYKLHSDISEF